MGAVLMLAAGLQQVGLVYTTAGKASFITGLYIVLVPIMGLFLGHKTGRDTWAGIIIAIPGLALLTLGDYVAVNRGDYLMMVGAVFWAIHLLLIGKLAPNNSGVALAFVQFLTSSLLCFIVAGATETLTLDQIKATIWPLLYVGIMSTSIAYTLQIVGQKRAAW